jgi:hypothetical protein
MSLVFQNIDPPPPSPPGEYVLPPAFVGGEDRFAGRRGGWVSIFWKTRDIGLPSYSNNLSTGQTKTICVFQTFRLLWTPMAGGARTEAEPSPARITPRSVPVHSCKAGQS